MVNKELARNKFDFKSRVLNTNDNLIVKIFRSIIILFGFLLSFFYSFFKLDNFYFFRRIFFLFYYFAKSFIDRKNCSIINKKIKKNDVFLDIGSAYGFYPYFLNKLNLNININVVEPDKVCLKYLRDLKIFKKKNNKIFEICAFSSKKKSKFYISNQNRGENSIHKDNVHDYSVVVKFDKIDNLFKKKKINFVKIDTQGSEIEVLKGMKNILRSKKLKLIIEYCPSDLKLSNTKFNLINFLKKYNFKILRLDLNQNVNTKNDLKDLDKSLKQTDLFCFK